MENSPPKPYDMFSCITHSNLQEFIKEVNRYTKIGWKLRGEMLVENDRYFQAVSIKSNEPTWEEPMKDMS